MRRFWIALLAFLGIACAAAAIAIPAYLVPKLKVVPLDLDITSDATTVGPDGQTGERFPAVILDRCSISQPKVRQFDAQLSQQRRSVIVNPSNAKQATLQSAQAVLIDRVRNDKGEESTPTVAAANDERKCNDGLLTSTIDRVSVNRKTSVPNGAVSSLQLEAAPEGTNVDDVSVHLDNRKGFQYKFGFDVKKTEYYYYDLNTRQDTVAKFVDEKTIDGVKTYHFVTEVPETDLSDLPNPQGDAPLGTILNMPAKWWGIKAKGLKPNTMLEMHRYAAATRHVWVEPTTGTIVDGLEEQHQYFKSVDDSGDLPQAVTDFRLDALKATFKWSNDTVSQQADRAQHYNKLLNVGGTIVPIVLGVLAAILLIAAALLIFLKRGSKSGDGPSGPDGDDGSGGPGPGPGGPDGDPDPDTVVIADDPLGIAEPTAYRGSPGADARPTEQIATPVTRHEAQTEQFTVADVPAAAYTAAEYDSPLPPVGSPADSDTGGFRTVAYPADDTTAYQRPRAYQAQAPSASADFSDVLNPTGGFAALPAEQISTDGAHDDFSPLSPHLGKHERG
ncbi:MAG: DUF3068 domain-containing protein [Gordonia sp. (in: high G+C Gram-positive bacteria)]